ncbi:MAG: NAD(P)/FAD-dependent oxidoreductase [Solirubrobacteraceae bacterium]
MGVGGGAALGVGGGTRSGRIVIAGAGLAGLRAAQAARAAGHEGEIVLVGDEPHAPYTRPPLSKELLKGEQTAEGCAFPGLDVLEAELRLSTVIASADADAHTVTFDDGDTLGYDRLIVATGAHARRLPGLTSGHTLRSLDDAARLLAALDGARRLAIVGAGFIGCEVAASVRKNGIEVALIDLAPQPLLPLGSELGERVAAMHREHGVELHLGAGIERVDEDGVHLAGGATVAADCVLIAVGATPSTGFLDGSGVELDPTGGVVCDATLTSVSAPDVLAAGDIACWPHPGAGGERVRVEHWTTAAEHGRLAGRNAMSEPSERAAHVAPPYFWSDQYDVKIQSVGFPAMAERIEIVESDDDGRRLVAEALDTRSDPPRLVGAVAFNHARRLAEYRRRLAVEYA